MGYEVLPGNLRHCASNWKVFTTRGGTVKRKMFWSAMTLTVLAILIGCASPTAVPTTVSPTGALTAGAGGTLTVYAASSLTGAFQELATQFSAANPNAKIEFNFAGSQDLRTQLEQGAQADVFAAADLKNMDTLHSERLISSTPQVFARNRLVMIVPKANPAGLKELRDLSRSGVKLIIADKSVPVGNYTLQMLDKLSAEATYGASFKDAVLKNVVSQENNVKAVLSKVSLGEADAGIVYTTDAQSAASQVTNIEVPDAFNVIALYPIAVVQNAPNAPLAQAWIAFVLSEQGQAVLAKYGFVPPS